MGRAKDISEEKKREICAYLDSGHLSYRDIVKKTKVSLGTVANVAKVRNDGNISFKSGRQNCGRKRKFSDRTVRKVVKMALEDRRKPAREILKQLRDDGLDISLRSIERIFSKNNLKCRRPAKKPKLTERMKKQRYIWAQLHRSYEMSYWNKVCYHKSFSILFFDFKLVHPFKIIFCSSLKGHIQ